MPSDKEAFTQHISQQFNDELEEIRTHLLEMGGLVEKQINDANAANASGDDGLARSLLAAKVDKDSCWDCALKSNLCDPVESTMEPDGAFVAASASSEATMGDDFAAPPPAPPVPVPVPRDNGFPDF